MGKGSGKGSRKAESKGDAAVRRSDFLFRPEVEPHAARKLEILKAHPEIKALFGPEPMTKWTVLGTVALQVGMAWLTLEWSWPAYLAAVYIVGATANHSLFLAIHELSHNLGFKEVAHNKYLAMFANFPIFIAYCITFKPFHMEHHRYQGDDGIDTDIPSAFGQSPTHSHACMHFAWSSCPLAHYLMEKDGALKRPSSFFGSLSLAARRFESGGLESCHIFNGNH
jgi:fatty acid desaturase